MLKNFKVSDVFGKAQHRKYHGPETLSPLRGGHPYICASNQNNGINKDISYVSYDGDDLTPSQIIAWGKQCPKFCYHDRPCITSQGMYFYDMTGHTEEEALYVCIAMTAATRGKYSYSNCLIGERMDDETIPLPVVESEDPGHVYTPKDIDWAYMREYISELEAEHIRELDAYLKATGLESCELSDEDRAALERFNGARMHDFKVEDVLSVEQTKSIVAKENLTPGEIPYVSRSASSNGRVRKCGNTDRLNKGNCITIGAESGVPFYQPDDFVAGNKIYRLSRDGIGELEYLYLVSALSKMTGSYSYSNARIPAKIRGETLTLPVIEAEEPDHVYTPDDIDWDFIERYIRAVEKQTISAVVRYKDRVIETTKALIQKKV